MSTSEGQQSSTRDVAQGQGGEEQDSKKDKEEPVLLKRHVKYFGRVLDVLPCSLSSLDSNRYAL